ncbi:MAG: TonB family protein [Planctomycetes bacterium]|nr:TonB family protein [Planctomycetota bacterium]
MKFRAIMFAAVLHSVLIGTMFYFVHVQFRAAHKGPLSLTATMRSDNPDESESLVRQPLESLPTPEETPVETRVQPLEEIPEPVVEQPLPKPPEPLKPAPEAAPRPTPVVPLVIPRASKNPPLDPPPAQPSTSPPPRSHRASGGAGGDNTPPALMDWKPPRMVRAHFRGRVIALIELDAAGKLRGVALDKGTGRRDWDDALLKALRDGTYRAAREDGRDVPSSLRQPIVFE